MPTAPCGHNPPQPNACRWCHLGLRKDKRYGRLWWPHLFSTYGEQAAGWER